MFYLIQGAHENMNFMFIVIFTLCFKDFLMREDNPYWSQKTVLVIG